MCDERKKISDDFVGFTKMIDDQADRNERERQEWNKNNPPTLEIIREEDGATIGIWSCQGVACRWGVKRSNGYNAYELQYIGIEVFKAIKEGKLDAVLR